MNNKTKIGDQNSSNQVAILFLCFSMKNTWRFFTEKVAFRKYFHFVTMAECHGQYEELIADSHS